MIDGLHPYPAYHPSGVPWLGDVPEHWEVVPLSAVSRPKSVTNQGDRELLSVYLGSGVIKFTDVADKRTNPTSEDLSSYQAVDFGDFVLNNQQAWRGSVGVSRYKGIVSPAYLVLALTSKLEPQFANLLFRERSMVGQYLVSSKGVGTIQRNLYWPHLKRVTTPLPPLPEQRAIVRYLDYVNRRIRRYVAAKRKLIALLEEEKQAIVNRAVTRGLDPNVRLKPSGVEWLGDVPEHWEVRRLKTVADMRVSNVDKHTREDEIYIRLCNYVDVYKNEKIAQSMPFMNATASWDEIERFRLERDDVLITKDSEAWDDIGVPALVTESADDLLLGYHLALLRPFDAIIGPYLAQTFQSKAVAHQFHVRANGVTRYGLTHLGIQSVRIPLPPLTEQFAIVEHLDQANADLDAAITRARRQIELIEEYRTRLIADVVTGKLDVREAAAQLPDEDNEAEPIGENGPLADGQPGDLYSIDESVEDLVMEEEVTA